MVDLQNAKAATIPFNADIGIEVGTPRPELSHAFAKGYTAHGSDANPGRYVAVVCENGAQPRARLISQYANIAGVSMPQLVNANVIRWPVDNSQRMVFIFEDTLGKPLAETDHGLAAGWKPEKVIDLIVKPTIYTLKSMRDIDLSHGAIRPTRFYDGDKKNIEFAMLGECLSAPTSSTQPVLFEPIERALAQPLGRGPSTVSDDLYALGVSAAVFMRSKDLLRNPSDADIIRAKQEIGTFACLIGESRLTGPILEFLRGVLADHSSDRWTIDDAVAWADGRRATPRQVAKRKPAQRSYEFCGQKFLLPQVLATEFIRRPAEASTAAESPELEQWLSRALADPETTARVEQAKSLTRDPTNRAGGPEKIAAYISVALDPQAPIRYKEIAFMPEGLGTLLSDAYARGNNVQSFVDILQSSLQSYWLGVHGDQQADIIAATQKFEQCRSLMRNAHNPGFGLERVVYLLNPDAPCLSPMFKNAYVRTPEDVVIGLNEACKTSPKPARLVDRHIIAFMAERDRKSIEMHIYDINSAKPAQSYLGTLRCLAALQKRARMDALPELTLWMAELAKPVYATFHDRDLREEIRRRVEKVKDEGRLWRLLDTLTDPEMVAKDMALFSAAFREYRSLSHEKDSLELRLQTPTSFGRRTGMEVAALVSAGVAFLVASGLAIVFMNQAGGGM